MAQHFDQASGIVAWTLSSKLFGHGLDTDRWEWQERLAAPWPCLGPDSAQSGAGRGGAVLLQLRRLAQLVVSADHSFSPQLLSCQG